MHVPFFRHRINTHDNSLLMINYKSAIVYTTIHPKDRNTVLIATICLNLNDPSL